MNIQMKVISFLMISFHLVQPLNAQQGIVSSGGDINTQEGSIAYSVGVVAFTSVNGEAGSVTQGIQQAYPFNTVGTEIIQRDNDFLIYPNPANQNLYLQLSGFENITGEMDLTARVYDMEGKLVLTQKLKNSINTIWIGSLPSSTYFIQLSQANSFLQSASFIKTN